MPLREHLKRNWSAFRNHAIRTSFMDIHVLQALFLGVIQGLSEFLPISSSGHLVLLPWVFDFPDPGLSFDVALHAGTLVAVLGYFWRDWCNIFRIRNDMSEYRALPNAIIFLVAATIPGAIAGLLFEKQAETIFRSPLLIASTLFIFGGVLLIADMRGKKARLLQEISLKDALVIGCAQALAIVPGVSRSGITITAGLFRGMTRASSARFSFLLSTPIIFAALLANVQSIASAGITAPFLVGVISSAISGYAAIFFLIRFVERASYRIFFWYRTALAVLIVFFFLFRL